MKNPPTLADIVYAQTFKKPQDLELRRTIRDARRIRLSDEMAAFLYTLTFELYDQGKFDGRLRRIHQRLDDCRHFSRLPHPVTWVEYSLYAMLQLAIELREQFGIMGYDDDETALAWAKESNTRDGWLLRQHGSIEAAVQADYFRGGIHSNGKAISWAEPRSAIWCTDDEPLPWTDGFHSLFGESASAFVAGIRAYDKHNVGARMTSWVKTEAEATKDEIEQASGHARMMWAFLSTFNKVPVYGEHRVEPSRGFVAAGSYHKFLDHKVLTINIPGEAKIRKIARDVLAVIRRRAHQVRGHWRDDWRLPKGNKAIWIGEHTRGNSSLGIITHDYSVEHDTK
jgi:hypothetical protein